MKPDRIEALLRMKPPGEPDRHVRPLLDGSVMLTVRADRARPGAVAISGLGWAAVLVVAAISITIGAVVLSNGPAGPSPSPTSSSTPPSAVVGVIPWIDATPAPSSTPEHTADAASLPACVPEGLALVAGGWGGATGSMAGGADLINLSGNACKIWNPVGAQLSDATGTVIARLDPGIAAGGSGPGAVAVPSGGDVTGTLVWMNWCVAAPKLPLRLTVYISGGPEKTVSIDTPSLTAEVRDEGGGSGIPRCDAPSAPSRLGAVSFGPPEPSSGGYQPEPCSAASLAAFSGQWGAGMGSDYSNLVVFNAGGVDCILPTSPGLELRDAHGVLRASAAPWPDPPTTLVLPAGWTADARMFFADWCIAPPALPLHLDLVVSGTALPIERPASAAAAIPVPFCLSAPATPSPAFGYDAPFIVPGMPLAPEPDPVDSLPLAVAISPLPAVAPGSTLMYTVTLTNVNTFNKPMNLALLCPSYVERLFLPNFYASIDTTRALNCGPVGTLAGGASATFEMRLPIPTGASPGTAGITWQLGQRGPAVKAQFQIAP